MANKPGFSPAEIRAVEAFVAGLKRPGTVRQGNRKISVPASKYLPLWAAVAAPPKAGQ